MDNPSNAEKRAEYATKLILTSIFLGAIGVFVWWKQNEANSFLPTTLDVIFLAFATLRLGRLIAYDLVMEPFRAPFAQTVPDSTGAGESVEPMGKGAKLALGQLISCPICSGTWVAAVLVFALYTLPGPTRVFLAIMATIGIAEVLNGVVESLCWSGQANRTRAGALLRKTQAKLQRGSETK